MIVLIRKRYLAALLCCFIAGMAVILWQGSRAFSETFSRQSLSAPVTVVLDPGHGGEDGGAQAEDGTVESRLNLELTLRLRDLLCLAGWQTVMTRTEDVTIADPGLATMRERKTSDLKNRVALVNGTENAILVSIHQNSLPSSPVTHGAQVFWNRQTGAEELARSVQDALNLAVNAGNEKEPRRIDDAIYLMKNISAPGILVECGFLSNSGETEQLKSAAYQRRLAVAITAGLLEG